jgi:hypothetical protein
MSAIGRKHIAVALVVLILEDFERNLNITKKLR